MVLPRLEGLADVDRGIIFHYHFQEFTYARWRYYRVLGGMMVLPLKVVMSHKWKGLLAMQANKMS